MEAEIVAEQIVKAGKAVWETSDQENGRPTRHLVLRPADDAIIVPSPPANVNGPMTSATRAAWTPSASAD